MIFLGDFHVEAIEQHMKDSPQSITPEISLRIKPSIGTPVADPGTIDFFKNGEKNLQCFYVEFTQTE